VTMPASAGVKRGKLYPVQGQIGGRNPCGATRRGRGALPSPRVGRTSRRATGGPDGWPSATAQAAVTELGLQIASLTTDSPPKRGDRAHRIDRAFQRGGLRITPRAGCARPSPDQRREDGRGQRDDRDRSNRSSARHEHDEDCEPRDRGRHPDPARSARADDTDCDPGSRDPDEGREDRRPADENDQEEREVLYR
jgi:hypothetical protein